MVHKLPSDLEQMVMQIIWEEGECSVRRVMDIIGKSKPLAYTTVATLLQRLHDKGLVTRKDKGIAFVYAPKLSKESYTKTIAQLFINKFFNSFGNVAIASFAKSVESLPKEKKEYLLELLEDHGKTK